MSHRAGRGRVPTICAARACPASSKKMGSAPRLIVRSARQTASRAGSAMVSHRATLPGALPVLDHFLGSVRAATPAGPGTLPVLDRFLGSVRAATPPTAHLLVAGNPPDFVFYRATYLLYPRTVYSTTSTDYAHAFAVPALTWRDLERRAHRDGAHYVLLWALPVTTRARVLVRVGAGRLVEVMP